MTHSKPKIVIIGATSAIAEHCARLWLARQPAELVLVGRDAEKTALVAADLGVRSPESEIGCRRLDFTDPAQIAALAAEIAAAGPIDTVLIAHGNLPDQAACRQDLAANAAALLINGVSPALFAEAFAGRLEAQGRGTLILLGSVAGDRGRKSNYVYGAAKGLVTRYAQGLQHRLAGSGVRVVLVKPGPTDTPMTSHLKQQGGMRLASVESVAAEIVAGAASGRQVIYAPAKWRLIMLVLRHLPFFVFRRLDI